MATWQALSLSLTRESESAGYRAAMALDLFAGIPVGDYRVARPRYELLLGGEPAFIPHETEAVWELDRHRYLYIVERTENPGGALVTIFVDDLDARVAAIGARGDRARRARDILERRAQGHLPRRRRQRDRLRRSARGMSRERFSICRSDALGRPDARTALARSR
jgi:hypothetical protein